VNLFNYNYFITLSLHVVFSRNTDSDMTHTQLYDSLSKSNDLLNLKLSKVSVWLCKNIGRELVCDMGKIIGRIFSIIYPYSYYLSFSILYNYVIQYSDFVKSAVFFSLFYIF